jgi:PAS domain S-box-containing protein
LKLDSTQYLGNDLGIRSTGAPNDQDKNLALNYVGVGVIFVNHNGNVEYFNPMAEHITGLRSIDVVGRQFNHVWGRLTTDPDALNFFALRSIETPIDFDVKIKPRPTRPRHLRIQVTVYRDLDKDRRGYVFTLQDLTQQHLKAQAEQRHHGQKVVADVAARLAHEIRNPLGSIELLATSISTAPDDHPEAKDFAAHISACVESINAIIENLIVAVNPSQTPDLRNIDLHATLEDSLFFAGHLLNGNTSVHVDTRLSQSPLWVSGDHQLLKQAVLNLILNSIQAMPHGGELSITSQSVEQHAGRRVAEIRIADTGIGIAAKDLERVFAPYYTTKTDGTGLGMSIVYNILTAHQGTIAIESEPLQGTTCIIQLPLIAQGSTDATVKASRPKTVATLQPQLRNQNVRAIHTCN